MIEGKVHFIRKVLEDNSISVLNKAYPVHKARPNNGVWATLSIQKENSRLQVFDAAPDVANRKLLASFPFEIPEVVSPHHSHDDETTHYAQSIDGYSIDKVLSYNAMS